MYAQSESVFPQQDVIWEESTFTIAGSFIRYRLLCGDTTINANTYAKIQNILYPFDGEAVVTDTVPPTLYAGALRSEEARVYFVPPGETDELLLYDFSLEVETSIELPNTTFGNAGTYNVTDADSVMVDGVAKRRLFLENVFGGTNDVWIEGVGSAVYGLLDRGLGLVFDYGSSLNCVQFNAEGFVFRPDTNGPCWMAVTACEVLSPAIDRAVYAGKITVFPNPSRGRVNVQLPDDGADWQLELWSLEGRLLRSINAQPQPHDWRDLPKGIYLLKVARDGQYVYSEKLVLSN
jgi:hypothetical protein